MKPKRIRRNTILLAQPIIQDPVFSGKAIFLLQYEDKMGAVGVIINNPPIGCIAAGEMKQFFSQHKDCKDIPEEEIKPVPLYFGGPCNTNGGLYFFHGYKEHSEVIDPHDPVLDTPGDEVQSFVIFDGLYYGTPITFAEIISKKAGDKFRFFTGQAAWAPGQLEHEIDMGAWKIIEGSPELFFDAKQVDSLLKRSQQTSRFMQMLEPQMN